MQKREIESNRFNNKLSSYMSKIIVIDWLELFF